LILVTTKKAAGLRPLKCLEFDAGLSYGWLKSLQNMLAICWQYAGNMLAICWQYAGNMLVICWQYAGNMLAICWQYAGNMLAICHADNMLAICWRPTRTVTDGRAGKNIANLPAYGR
jgi:hypothetical protein